MGSGVSPGTIWPATKSRIANKSQKRAVADTTAERLSTSESKTARSQLIFGKLGNGAS